MWLVGIKLLMGIQGSVEVQGGFYFGLTLGLSFSIIHIYVYIVLYIYGYAITSFLATFI